MPARWIQTFDALFRKKPFSESTDKPRLVAWMEAIRREMVGATPSGIDLQDTINDVNDLRFLTTAAGTDLDTWGEVFDLPRNVAEADAAYRARLLAQFQAGQDSLTLTAIEDAINTKGATYLPVMAVTDLDEYYKLRSNGGRRNESDGVADVYSLGVGHGLSYQDLLTFMVLIDRIPTPTEAAELAEILYDTKPAQTMGYIGRSNGGLPESFNAYGRAFSHGAMPLRWDDNMNRPLAALPSATTGDLYDMFNDAGAGLSWVYANDGGELVLFGDASGGGLGTNHTIYPRQDLDNPILLATGDMYVKADIRINDAGVGQCGVALRGDPVADNFYAVMFDTNGASRYQIVESVAGAINVLQAWQAVGVDMNAAYRTVEIWLEGQLLSLNIDGANLETNFDVGVNITAAGRWGFVTEGAAVDIYANDFLKW